MNTISGLFQANTVSSYLITTHERPQSGSTGPLRRYYSIIRNTSIVPRVGPINSINDKIVALNDGSKDTRNIIRGADARQDHGEESTDESFMYPPYTSSAGYPFPLNPGPQFLQSSLSDNDDGSLLGHNIPGHSLYESYKHIQPSSMNPFNLVSIYPSRLPELPRHLQQQPPGKKTAPEAQYKSSPSQRQEERQPGKRSGSKGGGRRTAASNTEEEEEKPPKTVENPKRKRKRPSSSKSKDSKHTYEYDLYYNPMARPRCAKRNESFCIEDPEYPV